jgi:hypothetical protein
MSVNPLYLSGNYCLVPFHAMLMVKIDTYLPSTVTTNRFGDVTCAKYANSRISLDRICAPPGQVKYVAPRETGKRSAAPQI